MNNTLGPLRSAVVAASCGFVGGLSVVASDAFATARTRAALISLAYAGIVIGSFVAVRHAGSYRRRFSLGLGAFLWATALTYGYMIVVVNPVLLGDAYGEHAWRLSFIAALGVLATAVPLALDASVGRFGRGQGGSRAPLTEDAPEGQDRDHDRNNPMAATATAS